MSNDKKYTNDDLLNMIWDLVIFNRINQTELPKYMDAIFKRHHNKPYKNDEKERNEAQKRNALQYYYRNKLIKMYEEIENKQKTEN